MLWWGWARNARHVTANLRCERKEPENTRKNNRWGQKTNRQTNKTIDGLDTK